MSTNASRLRTASGKKFERMRQSGAFGTTADAQKIHAGFYQMTKGVPVHQVGLIIEFEE